MLTPSLQAQGPNDKPSVNLGTCFGKKVTKVIRANKGVVRLGYRDVARITGDGVEVRGRANTIICAGSGEQTIRADKGTTRIRSGGGDDIIYLDSATWRSTIFAGAGDDTIYGSRGPDTIYASPKGGTRASDRDRVFAYGGNDRIYDFAGEGNMIYTRNGSDRVWSLGSATSSVWGGNGSDFIYSNGGGQAGTEDYLFGERGNDRLLADRPGGAGGAFLDPGPGDDWIRGTDKSDRILFQSGIKKIDARAGDDIVLSTSRGRSDIYGGEGRDTVSFASYTPQESDKEYGVQVNLEEGSVRGQGQLTIHDFEDVIGSAFDDRLTGKSGVANNLLASLGDDTLRGNPGDGDTADGGLGENSCSGFINMTSCNDASEPMPDSGALFAEIDESGVLLLLGGSNANDIRVDYDRNRSGYLVQSSGLIVASGLCQKEVGNLFCPDRPENLNGMLVYSGGGDDTVVLGSGIPKTLTTTLHGGSGANVIEGGASKDTVLTSKSDSAGSVLRGGLGVDNLYIQDNVMADGGSSHDVVHVKDPCLGGQARGNTGRDNLVFAGAEAAVWASIGLGQATWRENPCPSPLTIESTIEALEGTKYNDHLVLGQRFPEQEGPGKLLGREGIDTLDSRNGYRDTVTTGSGGNKNTVIADKQDKIIWGWGLSGY